MIIEALRPEPVMSYDVAELAKNVVAYVAAECDADDYQMIGKRRDAQKTAIRRRRT